MRKLASIILFLVIVSNSFGQSENSPLQISHLTGDFYVYKTFSDYKGNLISANAMYLVTSKGVVLFDVPWQKTQYQSLLDTIQKRHNLPVIAVFATHSHEDRAGDLSFYNKKGIKTYATAKTNELLKKDGTSRTY